MIATDSKPTGLDFLKGFAVVTMIYAVLALFCLVLVAT